jgi:hypothetical protein
MGKNVYISRYACVRDNMQLRRKTKEFDVRNSNLLIKMKEWHFVVTTCNNDLFVLKIKSLKDLVEEENV